jgi:hypothetical protein
MRERGRDNNGLGRVGHHKLVLWDTGRVAGVVRVIRTGRGLTGLGEVSKLAIGVC